MKEGRQNKKTHTFALERKIELAVQKYNMNFGGSVLLALSGGADSCALFFYLLKKAKENDVLFSAAHLNHMIRGAQAERDMHFCERICAENGVKLFLHTVDIPALAKDSGCGVEEVARQQRYAFFDRILSDNTDIKSILTAHNSTDNAETVIFNLARGSGIRGLIGIPPVRENRAGNSSIQTGQILRPLILCTKKEILDYCAENEIEYVTDSTNTDTKYTRNFIRGEILPKFERLTPAFEGAISRAGDSLREDNDFIESYADKFIRRNNILGGNSDKGGKKIPSVSVKELGKLHAAPFARVMVKMHRHAVLGLLDNRKECEKEAVGLKETEGFKEVGSLKRLPTLERKHIKMLSDLLMRTKEGESLRISLPGRICAECERSFNQFSQFSQFSQNGKNSKDCEDDGKFSFFPEIADKRGGKREARPQTVPTKPALLKIGENYIPQDDSVIILRHLSQNVCNKIDEKHKNIYKLSIHTVLSSDKIKGKLYVRCRKNGDSYRAGGMTRKLKKLLSDAKMPLSTRRTLPILCDDMGIVWVPGFPPRDGCAADSTQQGEKPLQILYYTKWQTGGQTGI